MPKRFVLLLLLFALPPLLSPLYRGYEALQLLRQMGGERAPPLSQIEVRAVAFTDRGQTIRADLYQGAAPVLAAIVLQHGAAAEGKDDARLVALAGQLAQARFAVLVPEMPGARALQISSEEIPVLLRAVDYLHHWRAGRFRGPIGIAGFSVAAGLALHAALQPEMQGRIDFILGVGAYYDLPQTLNYMTTGYFTVNGRHDYRQPNDYGKWIFILSNLHWLEERQQQELLRRIGEQRLVSADALVEPLISQLGSEGLSLYRYIDNRDPALSMALLQRLPDALRGELTRLDLANKELSTLQARVLLLHGRDDSVIPYTQSIALGNALPKGRVRVILLEGWTHVEGRQAVRQGWQMFRAIYALLCLRDQGFNCF
ncbi:MAG: alpha/beta hydrolase [Gammaproteobacteria bacterium]|nr:alpha/beta hydrolase [Gammaproteobacteria bacterium]